MWLEIWLIRCYWRPWLVVVVVFSCLVMSNSLQPHGLQHASLPCPSSFPRIHSNSCPLSQWCHPSISSSVIPFSSCPQSFPASGSFRFSISPSNEYSGLISFRINWFDLLAVQGTVKSLFQHHSSKASNSSVLSFLYVPTLTSIHNYWKNQSLD